MNEGPGPQENPSRFPPTAGAGLALFAFIVIFPGFFLYHLLVAAGHIPPILRGYASASSALMLPLLALAYLKYRRVHPQYSTIDAFFYVFVVYFAIVVLTHLVLGANETIVRTLLAVVAQFLALFTTVRLLNRDDWRFRLTTLVTFCLMSSIMLTNVSEGSVVIASDGLFGDEYNAANYQDYAISYTVTTLLCVVHLRSGWSRSVIYAVALVVQFLNGARSEFIGFLVAACLIEACLARSRLLLTAAALISVATAVATVGYWVEGLPTNRVVDLIEYGASGSLSERQLMLADALRTLVAHPVLGDFGSYEPGEYAHNLLSVWVDLGLAGFLFYCALLFMPIPDLVRQFKRRSRDPDFVLVLAMFGMAVLLLVVAKHFTYGLFPIALGLYAREVASRTCADAKQNTYIARPAH